MKQGYWYVSDASKKIQEKFFKRAEKYGAVSEAEAKSIIFGSDDQTVCVGGQVFRTGVATGAGSSLKVISLLLGLNHCIYDQAFDGTKYVVKTRTPFYLNNIKVLHKSGFVMQLAKAVGKSSFIAGEGNAGRRLNIDSAELALRDFTVKLTVRSGDGEEVAVRAITLKQDGTFAVAGNASLAALDQYLSIALITGWGDKVLLV